MMLHQGDGIFLHIPGEHKNRVLHPATILRRNDRNVLAELEERDLPFECDEAVVIYFEKDRTFMQQTARVESYEESEPAPVVDFEVTGEPASAECREHYRVSIVMADLTAELAKESQCPLLDVSAMGFSVIASQTYHIGQLVDAVLWHDGQRYAGNVCVQSVRDLNRGRIRYGLHSIEDTRSTGNINRGLLKMTTAFQRQQLQRISGAW